MAALLRETIQLIRFCKEVPPAGKNETLCLDVLKLGKTLILVLKGMKTGIVYIVSSVEMMNQLRILKKRMRKQKTTF